METNHFTFLHTGPLSLRQIILCLHSCLFVCVCFFLFVYFELTKGSGDELSHLMSCLFCLHSDEDEVAKLLLDAGANVNCKNQRSATPLIIAAVKGNHSVLRVLANHPGIQLHMQVSTHIHQCLPPRPTVL